MSQEIALSVIAICVVAAFLAGFVDAVAGGGGLIQLPVLLLVFPNAALASLAGTNKSASIVGTTGAAATYARKMPIDRKLLAPMATAAFVGSAGGAALVTRVSRVWFEPVILVVLIAITIFTLLRPDVGAIDVAQPRGPLASTALAFAIGFYDGIMGPGTGMFLVLGLVAYVGCSFLTASALAKFVNVATNLAALVVFIPIGHVMWAVTAFMAPANLLGGLVGARTALNRGSAFVRAIFLTMIAVLIIRLVISI